MQYIDQYDKTEWVKSVANVKADIKHQYLNCLKTGKTIIRYAHEQLNFSTAPQGI